MGLLCLTAILLLHLLLTSSVPTMALAANSSNAVTSNSRGNGLAAADAFQRFDYSTEKDEKVAHNIPTSTSKTFGESSVLSLQAEQPHSDIEIGVSESKNEPAAPPPD